MPSSHDEAQPPENLTSWGARLREKMKYRGWTPTKTSLAMGRSSAFVADLFLGRIDDPAPYAELEALLFETKLAPTLSNEEAQAHAAQIRATITALGWTLEDTGARLGLPDHTLAQVLNARFERPEPYLAALEGLTEASTPSTPLPKTLSELHAPPAMTPELRRLRALSRRHWPDGNMKHVGAYLSAMLLEGLLPGATRNQIHLAIAPLAGRSRKWVTYHLEGKAQSPSGYATIAGLLGVSLEA